MHSEVWCDDEFGCFCLGGAVFFQTLFLGFVDGPDDSGPHVTARDERGEAAVVPGADDVASVGFDGDDGIAVVRLVHVGGGSAGLLPLPCPVVGGVVTDEPWLGRPEASGVLGTVGECVTGPT